MSDNKTQIQVRKMVHYSISHHDFEYSDAFMMKVLRDNVERQACEIIAELFASEEDDKQIVISGLLKNGTATIYDMTIYDIRIEDLETITVFVRGGLIQDIQGIPETIRIKVQDYDIGSLSNNVEKASTEHDAEGIPCVISIWESED